MSHLVCGKRIDWQKSSRLSERLEGWAERSTSASRLVADEPLSRHSSLRIGGPATHWVEVGTGDDLRSLLEVVADASFYCVGLGSNVLFPDEGIDAPVVKLTGDLAQWDVDEDGDRAVVDVGAGTVNAHLVRGLLDEGWVGAGFLHLIPGTFGGAVALNAGTKEKELRAIVDSVELAVRDDQRRCWRFERRGPDELEMSYRHTALPEASIVVGGRIRVRDGDVEEARRRMDADKERRDETQPYRLASVGSTFANPDGDYAGRLIDEVGLKGETVGGAKISELHANFFINESDATTEDFLRLMAMARHRVRRDFDTTLRPEVKFVGFDGLQKLRKYERQLEGSDV